MQANQSLQEVRVKKRNVDEKELFRRPPKEEDCEIAVKAPCRLIDDETGEVIAVALTGIPRVDLVRKFDTLKLGSPLGGGRRLAGYSTGAALTFGFSPKRPVQSTCQACRSGAIYRDYPWAAETLTPLTQEAWRLMAEANAERQEHLTKCATEIKPDWKITDTGFTSGIINKNTPLRYHYDAGNYPDSWSAMLWLANGIEGGALAIPMYNAKISLANGAWLFFSGQRLLHGVTPIKICAKKAYRYSVVFYANMEMRNCGTPTEELANAKKRRTKTESQERAIR